MRLLWNGLNWVLCVFRVLDGFRCHYSFGRSRANALKDYSFRMSGAEGNPSIYSTTAAKCGKWCRCGRSHERQCCPEGLYQWCGRKGHSATAAKCGKRCHCGRGHGRQCSPEGLNQWCGGKGHSATAAKCGKRCRCGEKGRKGQDSDREEVTGKRWRYVAKERERK